MTHFFALLSVSHVVQAIIVGAVLAFLTAQLLMNAALNAVTTTVNGWGVGAFVFIYFWPRMTYSAFKRAIIRHGLGGDPIPVNTLYASPNLSSAAASNASLLGTGTNDVLYVGGVLDLSKGAQVLR